MAPELRNSGISVVGDIAWGTHFCHFYETKEDLIDILVPYFKAGLENNEFCIWVVSDSLGEEEARSALRKNIPEADLYLAGGHMEIVPYPWLTSSRQQSSPTDNIEIIPHTDWYLKGGAFMAERALNGWYQKLADATARGYTGLRANGDEAWLTEENWKAFSDYEKSLDENLAGKRMIVLCSYPLSSSSAGQVLDVVDTHELALVRRQGNWEVVETSDLRQARQEIKRLNEELEQRVIQRTRELADTNERLRMEIVERNRAEDALRQSEDRLRLVINTIPTMAWSVRPDGAVDFVNQRWLDYAGLTLEEEIANPNRPIHPNDLSRVQEKWQASMAAGEAYEDEIRLQRADGQYRWFLVRTEPLRDEQGNIVKWYGSSVDIEDRKQAEEKLKRSESQMAEAQSLAHVGSWHWDIRTNTLSWSDELYRIFGLQPGQIKRSGDSIPFIHPEDRDRVWGTVIRSLSTTMPYDIYYRIVRPDGTERTVHTRGSILSDEQGEPLEVFGYTQDVTELKRAEEKLKETSEQLRALSGSLQSAREEESKRIAREIHDELGGALTSWRWDLDEIREAISDSLDSSQVATLRTKIDAMIKLTEATLNTVRRLASELRPAALELGLAQAVEWQAYQFENRTGIPVRLEASLDRVDLNNGAATAVFRILQEALTNIQRHARATEVTITMKEVSAQFLLTIHDNGQGMIITEEPGRRSLGLLGMRERAHLAGGTFNIESAEGKGTKIIVQVPLTTA